MDLLMQDSNEMGLKVSWGPGLGIGWIMACFQAAGSVPELRDLLKRFLIVVRALLPRCLSMEYVILSMPGAVSLLIFKEDLISLSEKGISVSAGVSIAFWIDIFCLGQRSAKQFKVCAGSCVELLRSLKERMSSLLAFSCGEGWQGCFLYFPAAKLSFLHMSLMEVCSFIDSHQVSHACVRISYNSFLIILFAALKEFRISGEGCLFSSFLCCRNKFFNCLTFWLWNQRSLFLKVVGKVIGIAATAACCNAVMTSFSWASRRVDGGVSIGPIHHDICKKSPVSFGEIPSGAGGCRSHMCQLKCGDCSKVIRHEIWVVSTLLLVEDQMREK